MAHEGVARDLLHEMYAITARNIRGDAAVGSARGWPKARPRRGHPFRPSRPGETSLDPLRGRSWGHSAILPQRTLKARSEAAGDAGSLAIAEVISGRSGLTALRRPSKRDMAALYRDYLRGVAWDQAITIGNSRALDLVYFDGERMLLVEGKGNRGKYINRKSKVDECGRVVQIEPWYPLVIAADMAKSRKSDGRQVLAWMIADSYDQDIALYVGQRTLTLGPDPVHPGHELLATQDLIVLRDVGERTMNEAEFTGGLFNGSTGSDAARGAAFSLKQELRGVESVLCELEKNNVQPPDLGTASDSVGVSQPHDDGSEPSFVVDEPDLEKAAEDPTLDSSAVNTEPAQSTVFMDEPHSAEVAAGGEPTHLRDSPEGSSAVACELASVEPSMDASTVEPGDAELTQPREPNVSPANPEPAGCSIFMAEPEQPGALVEHGATPSRVGSDEAQPQADESPHVSSGEPQSVAASPVGPGDDVDTPTAGAQVSSSPRL